MKELMKKFVRIIEKVSEFTGQVVKWMVPILVLMMAYEVIMRYVFSRPTKWAFTASYMFGATMFVLGQSYLQKHKGNIRVDLIYAKLSLKTQLIIDSIFNVLLFLPVYALLTRSMWNEAFRSYRIMEIDINSLWRPPLWPFKMFVALGYTLFLIQFFADTIANIVEYTDLHSKGGNGTC